MSKVKFTAKKRSYVRVPEGEHLAIVTSVSETVSAQGTPQIKAAFKVPNVGTISKWFNMLGYKKDADGNYETDKDGNRIADDANTEACIDIFCGFGADCNIKEGAGFELSDLVDKEVGIVVSYSEEKDDVEVKYTKPAELIVSESEEMQA